MKKVFFGLFVALVVVSITVPSIAFALPWINPGVTFGSTNWNSVASDADGSNLAAGLNGQGYIYISDDSGATWTQKNLPSTGSIAAVKIASDDDGSNLIVGGNNRLFTSDDYGETWTERQPDGDIGVPWAVASDSDGSHLIAAYGSESVFTSDDGGVSWTPHNPSAPGVSTFLEVASDSDGSHLMAGAYDGRLYTSSDFGDTWTERQPVGNVNRVWRSLASDADGSNLIAGVESGDNGRLYTSSNGGANWTERQPAGDINVAWAHVASDATGQHLLAGNTTRVYFSDDGGVTWNEQQPDGDANFYWNALASDADGSNLIIAAYSGNLFLYPDTIPPVVDALSPNDDAVEVALQNQEFSVGFDESVSPGAGNITIHRADDDTVVETFDAADGGIVVFDESDMYFSASVALDAGTEYYILIDSGAIEDETGNVFAGISDPTTWSFTTVPALTFDFERISVDAEGLEANSESNFSSVSSDGRFVAFQSYATNLVLDDTNEEYDIFIYDRTLDTIERVSVDAEGAEGDGGSRLPSVSSDGRYVAFESYATNLVADDTNDTGDVFVRDSLDGSVERVSVDAEGAEGNEISSAPSISSDGQYVAFYSYATNLVPGDTNDAADIFVYDRTLDTIERVSVDAEGAEGDGSSDGPKISSDGRYVVFQSQATNLVPDDTNEEYDIFIYDRTLDTIERISVDAEGAEGNGSSNMPAVSSDGRYVAFESYATNLVAGDTNGMTDIFVYDRTSDSIERIADDEMSSQGAVLSGDGTYVVFKRGDGDVNDLYRYNLQEDTLLFITEGSKGFGGEWESFNPAVSSDGRTIAFTSSATNLVDDDTNEENDVFVWEEVVEDEEEPPAEEEEGGGGSGSRRRVFEQQTDSDVVNVTLEQLQLQLIELLKQLIQILLAQQQN